MKKIIALVLSAIMLLSALPFGVFAEEVYEHVAPTKEKHADEIPAVETAAPVLSDVKANATSGTTGDCTWYLEGTTLTIFGNGGMEDYNNTYSPNPNTPWWENRTNIKSIIIEQGVTYIGDMAFEGCSGFTTITIPDSVTSIGTSAFFGCTGLTTITIPGSVKVIEGFAFYGCTSLTSATIENGVISIGGKAFVWCSNLTSVKIGKSVTNIDSAAFMGCDSLVDVWYEGSESDRNKISIDSYNESLTSAAWHYNSCVENEGVWTHVYDNACDTHCNVCFATRNNVWDAHVFEGESVLCKNCGAHRYLKYEADQDGNGFTITGCDASVSGKLVIPDVMEGASVSSIGSEAFEYCSGLTSVTIPDTVTSIGFCVFKNCSGLTSIAIPDSVTSIGVRAFEYCSSLTSITIPDSVTSIGSSAFYGCTGLTSITIPDSVRSIGNSAFYDCKDLTSVVIGDSVTSLNGGVFNSCSSLKTLVLPTSITAIEKDAFYGCNALSDIWYLGTSSDRNGISRAAGNDALVSATWHFIDNACDATCNECGKTRATEHIYDNAEDLICNECGYERPPYTLGDLDGNEGVSSADAIYLLYHTLLGNARYPVSQPVDYNKDGAVSSADAIYLLYHSLLGADRYPL